MSHTNANPRHAKDRATYGLHRAVRRFVGTPMHDDLTPIRTRIRTPHDSASFGLRYDPVLGLVDAVHDTEGQSK